MNRIDRLCDKYGLGNLISEPEVVTGGLLHRMYRISTDKDEYAIKVLNPEIMKRPEAYCNMINAEAVANALASTVPLVAAKTFEGESLLEFEESFYMIFDWVNGKSIFVPHISIYHCEQVGRILGKIHAANITVDGLDKNHDSRTQHDWNGLLETAKCKNEKCYTLLQENITDITGWDIRVTESVPYVKQHQVISHRDLDPKNILWDKDVPHVIDWEAAGYVNPFQELIEVLNYWISDETGKYNIDKFMGLMQAYTEYMDIRNVNWDAVLDCSFDGMLGWLEYSIKRALGVVGNKASDMQEGIQQTLETIHELKKYEKQLGELKAWINLI